MAKKVIIVHGWGGSPHDNWIPWLALKIKALGHSVIVPQMPDTEHPKIEPWVSYLADAVGALDEETYFIGHSIGCQTILRYLSSQEGICGGCLFVAGWFHLANLEQSEEEVAAPWLETTVDTDTAAMRMHKAIAVCSDDDPYEVADDEPIFKDQLGCETIIESGKGHYTEDEEPSLLPLLQKLLHQ